MRLSKVRLRKQPKHATWDFFDILYAYVKQHNPRRVALFPYQFNTAHKHGLITGFGNRYYLLLKQSRFSNRYSLNGTDYTGVGPEVYEVPWDEKE